jgi:hypothetical protein
MNEQKVILSRLAFMKFNHEPKKIKFMKTNKLYSGLIALLIIAFAAPVFSQARVQVIHNSADAAAEYVDVWLNDVLLIDNFKFRTATPFIDAPAGERFDITIQPANSTDTTNGLARFTYTLEKEKTYILVANGIVVPTGYSPYVPFNIYVYDLGRESAKLASNTDVLVFHGSTDAPVVDVVEVGLGAGTIINDLNYANFSGYLELPTADYTLQIRDQSGTTTVAEYAAPLASLSLGSKSISVLASGFLNPAGNNDGPAFGLWVATAEGGDLIPLPMVPISTARVQIIHNSADIAAQYVDVWVNGQLLVNNFQFRTATPFIDAPANTDLTVTIAPANSSGVSEGIANFTFNLTGGSKYILVANGVVSGNGYSPLAPFNIFAYETAREAAIAQTNTDILVFHGSTDAPVIDIVENNFGIGTIVDNLSYGEFAGYLEVPASEFTFEIRDASGRVTVATFEAPLGTYGLQGKAVTVLASGFLNVQDNSDGPAFGLWVALSQGGNLIPLPMVMPADPTARIQVIHNAADAAAEFVDVWLNDALALDNFEFRTATPFIDVPAGVDFDVTIQPANSTDTTNGLARFTYNLMADHTYVLVANGIVIPDGYNPPTPFDIYVYDMGREMAAMSGNTDVLVFHGSTDAPVVDVVEVGAGAGTIINDMPYSQFAGYLELPTADYSLQIRDITGTTTVAEFAAPLATLGLENAALVVLASGFLSPADNNDGPAFGLWVALPSGGDLIPLPNVPISTARVQVIHNSSDAAAQVVDVWLNDILLIDNFSFRTASPFIDAPANTDITVTIAPATSTSVEEGLVSFNYNLAGGSKYILVANGIVIPDGYNPPTPFDILVYPMAREFATNNGNTDVLVFHGSTDAPVVDVVEVGVGAGTIIDNLAYSEFAGYLQLPTDDYYLEIRDESGSVTVASYSAPLETFGLFGQSIAVIASGFLNPANNNNGPAFGLFVALPSGGELIELGPATTVTENFSEELTSKIFPNPARNIMNVQFELPAPADVQVKIYDLTGSMVANQQFSASQTGSQKSIDISKLPAGMYFVKIQAGSLKSVTKLNKVN